MPKFLENMFFLTEITFEKRTKKKPKNSIVALVLATTYACKDTIVTVNRLTNDAQQSADHDPIIGSLIY